MYKFPGLLTVLVLAFMHAPVSARSDGELPEIRLPSGFSIEIYAEGVTNARSMALGDDGTVYVATRRDGRVFAVEPQQSGPPRVVTIAEKLMMPNGIAYHDGDLYVAELSRLIRFSDIDRSRAGRPVYELVDDSLPEETHHGWRYLAIGPDDKLYTTIGAPCNVCDRDGFGLITRQDLDGGNKETIASGVRNSVGLTWHPESGELWFTDNGRDMLGDDIPPGELNRVRSDGQNFGFPFCHAGEIVDPEFGSDGDCSRFTAPALKLGPHVAPLGLLFYDGTMFPEEYYGHLFIAEHGSWNRTQKIGYRVMLVRFEDGEPLSYEPFADGWLQGDSVSGRPVDLLLLKDGSMIVSDDQEGRLYRISYAASASGDTK